MKAIRNYKGYKGHIAVYLTKDDITKIIRDYFENAADEVSGDTYEFDLTFEEQFEFGTILKVYIQPKKNIKFEESHPITIGVENPSLIFKNSTFFKEDE